MGNKYTISVIERMLKKISVDSNNCWNWTGSLQTNGYGTACVNYKNNGAHRHLYKALYGEIPENMQLDHLCRNRKCINPNHLELVTAQENVLRGKGIAANNYKKTHCSKGHLFDDSNTYIKPLRGGRDCRICRQEASRRYNERKVLYG